MDHAGNFSKTNPISDDSLNIEKMNTRKFDIVASFACVGTLCCWSLGPIFIKYLSGHVDSWTQNLLRYSVACSFWLPFLAINIQRKRIDAKLWRKALLPAAANVTMQSLWAAGFYYIGPAFMTLLSEMSVIWIASFSLVFFADERGLVRSKRFWLGLMLSAVGVVGVIYHKQDFAASGTMTGIVIALVTAFMWAVYTLSVRIAFRDTDSRSGFSIISIYTVAGLLVLGIIFGNLSQCVTMVFKGWVAVVISAVTAIALGHVFYYAAIRRIGATIPMLVILAQPFAVFAISRMVFEETLNRLQLVFGVVLLAGAALSIWAQQHLIRDL